jgi:ribosomal protein S18 acetylase RimI-like enzyme
LGSIRAGYAGALSGLDPGARGSVPGVSVSIEIAADPSDELREALSRLLPQLSSSPPPDQQQLAVLVADPGSVLFVARLDGVIVGSLTLVLYRIPTGLKAWIEDVVVDAEARGHGIGEQLNQAALDEARQRGVKGVSLTSRPSREAANRLYQRIGFTQRQTNVYRYDF